jgi:hypothetical protein
MVLTGETGAPGGKPVCPSVTPPTTQPPWDSLEMNSGLRGERLTFCFYRLTVVPDAMCMVQLRNTDMYSTNSFCLHHSSRTASHAAPPSPPTATPSSRNGICVSDNWPGHSEAGYWPNSPCRGRGSLPGQSVLRLWWTKCHCDKCCYLYFSFPPSVGIVPPVLHTDVRHIQ